MCDVSFIRSNVSIACFPLFLLPSDPSSSSIAHRVHAFQTAQPHTFATFSARSMRTRSCAWPTLHVPVFIRHWKVQQDTFLPLQRTALLSALKASARTILSPRHFACFSDLFPKKKQKEHIHQLWPSTKTHFSVRTLSEMPGAPPQRFMFVLVMATEK